MGTKNTSKTKRIHMLAFILLLTVSNGAARHPHLDSLMAIRELRLLFNAKNPNYVALFQEIQFVDATPLSHLFEFMSFYNIKDQRTIVANKEFQNFKKMSFVSIHSFPTSDGLVKIP